MAMLGSLGGRIVPWRYRIAATVVLGLVVTPCCQPIQGGMSASPATFGMVLVSEFMLGVTLGLCLRLVLLCFQLASGIVSQMSGWQLGAASSPDGEEVALSRLFSLLSVAMFFAIGGHRLLMSAFLDGLEQIPIGSPIAADRLSAVVVDVLAQSFQTGLRLAAPLVGVLVLAGLVAGLAQRTMPRFGALATTIGWVPLAIVATILLSLGGIASCVDQPGTNQSGKWLRRYYVTQLLSDAYFFE